MKVLKVFILSFIIGCCIGDSYQDEKTSRDLYYPRKKGKQELLFPRKGGFSTVYFNPLHGLELLGGIQSLAAFVIFKIKLVLVVVTIIGVAFLALKFFGLYKYSNYLYKDNSYPIIESPQFDHGGYSVPIYNDHTGHDWSSAPGYFSRSAKDPSFHLPSHLIDNIEDIMFSLINLSNQYCQHRLTCQINALIKSPDISSEFATCSKLHNCTDEIHHRGFR